MEGPAPGYARGALTEPAEIVGFHRPAEPRRSTTVPNDPQLQETLPPEPGSVAYARRLIWRFVADCAAGVDRDAAGLLTSELVTNAIRHGGASGPDDRVRVRVVRTGARVRVEVRDDGPGFEVSVGPPAAPADDRETGMGLALVARLAVAWAAEREGRSTVVWFEVDPERAASPLH
jgi:anti-sigma regulatory factor (Ser/Thr protein kinase)